MFLLWESTGFYFGGISHMKVGLVLFFITNDDLSRVQDFQSCRQQISASQRLISFTVYLCSNRKYVFLSITTRKASLKTPAFVRASINHVDMEEDVVSPNSHYYYIKSSTKKEGLWIVLSHF